MVNKKCFFLVLIPLLLFPRMIFAQTTADTQPLRLITSPLPITLSAVPHSTVSAELKIKNDGTHTENIVVSVMKFSAYEEEGKPKLLDGERGDDYLTWVTFSQPSFSIAPNEWKTITATFTVPETAAFGYYYAITFARETAAAPAQKLQTSVVGATAVLALLEVKAPGAKKEAQVLEFSTDKRIYEFLPVTFDVKVRNSGNVHIAPHGNIFLDQGRAKDLAVLEVNGEQGNILPQSNRVFSIKWEDGFPQYVQKTVDGAVALDARGNQREMLKWDMANINRLRFGKYTAHLLMVYDDGQKDVPIEGKLEFWVIPWRIFGALAVVFLFVLIGLYSTLRKIAAAVKTRVRG